MGLRRARRKNTSGLVSLSLLIYFLWVVSFLISHYISASLKAERGVEGSPPQVIHAPQERGSEEHPLVELEGKTAQLHEFIATAYCLKGQTSSGVQAQEGVIAADPAVLPIGSVVRLQAGRYSGIYTVLDTGAKIRGRIIDIWVRDIDEALRFGVRKVRLQIVRHGWNPAVNGEFPPE